MSVKIIAVHKRFGGVQALEDVNLTIKSGEFLTLLGPSGCGKTTLLRILAGLEQPDRGEIRLGDRNITAQRASERPVNTVFQNYALFPHLDVRENVAFGLRSRKVPAAEIKSRVDRVLELVRLESLGARRPSELSGGQQQRVALARALVNEPQVLLLDEPMSALDATLRSALQLELHALHERLGGTFVLVTHDQDEALSVSDQIAVMHAGRIVQSGAPREIYQQPATRYVASFLGQANFIAARRCDDGRAETEFGLLVTSQPLASATATLCIRPEEIVFPATAGAPNQFAGEVEQVVFRGDHCDIWLKPHRLHVRLPSSVAPPVGAAMRVMLPAEKLRVLHE
jgi:spermidine/putrescine transport system ATP-binding protein